VQNVVFYATASTVIPLLLIAMMATRSLRPGEFRRQSVSTVLVFGLPIVGELAAFVFLFLERVPYVLAIILATLTWFGLLSQLGLAFWWLIELIGRGTPLELGEISDQARIDASNVRLACEHVVDVSDSVDEEIPDAVTSLPRADVGTIVDVLSRAATLWIAKRAKFQPSATQIMLWLRLWRDRRRMAQWPHRCENFEDMLGWPSPYHLGA
jgi:hypothetical protein